MEKRKIFALVGVVAVVLGLILFVFQFISLTMFWIILIGGYLFVFILKKLPAKRK